MSLEDYINKQLKEHSSHYEKDPETGKLILVLDAPGLIEDLTKELTFLKQQ